MDQHGYGSNNGGGYGGYGGPRPPPGAFFQGPSPGGAGGGASRFNQGPPMGGRDDYTQGNVEMASLAQNASSFAGQGQDANFLLNECRDIDQGINQIDEQLKQLRLLQDRSLNEADGGAGSATTRQMDAVASDTMALYRGLTERVRHVKSSADAQQARFAPHVGRIDRRLKQAIQQFQQVEAAFRKRTQDQMARQYRIVRPDAPEAEVRAAVEDPQAGAQVFQQALMRSGRQGQAHAVLSAVQDRHAAIQKIEQQMVELAQLFQDMDTLVTQQETQVMQIEEKAEAVVENLSKGNEEIEVAVETAKSTRKKKWICLGITILILAAIGGGVAIYFVLNNKPGAAAAPATPTSTPRQRRSVPDVPGIPGLEIHGNDIADTDIEFDAAPLPPNSLLHGSVASHGLARRVPPHRRRSLPPVTI